MAKTEREVEGPPALKRNLLLAAAGAVLVLCAVGFVFSGRSGLLSQPIVVSPVVAVVPAPQAAAPAVPDRPGPSFDVVRVNPLGNAVIAGRAPPNATVTILDGASTLGHVTADANGQFVFLPDAPLPADGQQLSLSAVAPDGVVTRSEGSVLLLVPDRTGPAVGQPTAPLAVLTGPNAAPRLLTPPPEADPASRAAAEHRRLGLDVVDYDDHGAIRFAGSAPAKSVVRLYVDNRPVGDATADMLGRWTMTPPDTLTPGMHRLRVDQISPQGRVIARVEQPFQRVVIDAASIGRDRVLVQPGENLWRLARVAYGSGTRYTVIYQANRDQIRDPRLIYPGQAFAVPGGGAP